jgi:hypothetical protein
MFHRIRPQRPSNIWKYSTTDGKGAITRMVFAYDYWNPDPIFQDIGYFFVTRSTAAALAGADLTGYSLEDVPTVKSKDYDDSLSPREPEPVSWLKIHGEAGKDDFGIQLRAHLIVSERVLELLRRQGLQRAEVLEYDPDMRPPTMEQFMGEWEARAKGRGN